MRGSRFLALTPWRRAPWLLLGQRGVVVTIVVVTAVVVTAIASLPVFLSSVGTATVAAQAAERCGLDTGASVSVGAPPDGLEDLPNPFVSVGDRLGAPRRWVVSEGERLSDGRGGDEAGVTVLYADDALDHVQAIEGDPLAQRDTPGWWITDRAAEMTGLSVGDQATVATITAPVVGIYADRAGPDLGDFWCAEPNLFLPKESGGDIRLPPPVVLVDLPTAATVVSGAGAGEVELTWRAPLGAGVTDGELPTLIDDLACADPTLELAWCEGRRPAGASAGRTSSETPLTRDEAVRFVRETLGSHLGYVSRRSDGIVATVAAGVVPIGVIAAAAGLAMMAAAGALWHERRVREIRLLLTRGMGPGSVAVKAVLEMSVPMMVGAGLGMAVSLAARWFGPSWVVEGRAVAVAAGLAVVGLSAVVGVVAATTYARARALEGTARRRIRWSWIPWELILVWGTVAAYQRLGEWQVPVSFRDDASSVDAWGLLFPMLFLVTSVVIIRRVLSLAWPLLRARSLTAPNAAALATRRLYRARTAVLGLMAAAAIAAGVLGLAVTLQRSLATTMVVKGLTFTGSDVAVQLGYGQATPEIESSTIVISSGDAELAADGTLHKAVLRVIDPSTFASAAFWDSSMADRSLETILAELSEKPTDGTLPAVLVGADGDLPDGRMTLTLGASRRTPIAVEPIPGVAAFPGMNRAEPTLFLSAAALEQLHPTFDAQRGTHELWAQGDPELVLRELERDQFEFTEIRSHSVVADRLAFQTVDWTFDFVIAVGAVAGVLVLAGVTVYLDAAHRGRLLGYTFLRRMGVSSRTHRRAIAVEMTGTVVVGAVLGLTLAWVAGRLAYGRIDPIPGFAPHTVFRPALATSVLVVATCFVAVVVNAWFAQRRLDREDPSGVLRAGT